MPALRVDRRLAAILAADVVAYSRLIERDEAGTLERLKTLRRGLIEPILASHDGRIAKLMGDGALVEFPSATEAVAAAVEIQQATADHEHNRPEAEQIRFRVGINLGDVVHEDGDIFGEGVNLAARLQALSEPGGICVSRNVYEQARNRLPVAFTFMGSRRVKNIAEPVEVWRVVPEGSPAQARGSRTMWLRPAMAAAALLRATLAGLAGSPRQWGARDGNASARPMTPDPVLAMPSGPTIAVLPFANMSGDADREYLADGMTEEIITALSRFREVHVLARNATSEFKGKAVDIRRVGRELGAEWIIDGSMRRVGDGIRVTAQLVDANSGGSIWAENFDRTMTPANLVEMQDEIASKIAAAIGDTTGGAIAQRRLKDSRGIPPADLSVYRCFLFASDAALNHKFKAFGEARSCLERAVQQEPGYADAWVTLSLIYSGTWTQDLDREHWGSWDPRQASLEAARNAVDLAPESARARVAMARAAYFLGDLDRFYGEAETAFALNPNDALALGDLGTFIAYTGHWERGVALVKKAMALHPASHPKRWWFASAKDHFRKGEYAEALHYFKRAETPGWWLNPLTCAYTYGHLGDSEAAKKAIADLYCLRPGYTIANAVTYYRKFSFEQSYLDRMIEGLRKAGLPEGPSP